MLVPGRTGGRGLTLFLVILILTGGSVASMDIIAGEKERGSLETILTTAVKRTEVVSAKQLTILAVALTITFIQIAEILAFVTYKIIPLPKGFVIEAPAITIVTLLFLFIPVAAFISAVLLMVSAYSKSYKEAQWAGGFISSQRRSLPFASTLFIATARLTRACARRSAEPRSRKLAETDKT
jgi:ABC-type Na+ efflux pump permease subunit